MKRYCLFLAALAYFAVAVAVPAVAGAEVASGDIAALLASRKVVGSVGFSARSAQLSPVGKASLREMAARVKAADEAEFLRVEGWAEKTGKPGGTNLALERAKAVVQYLQEDLQVKRGVYFTGIGAERTKSPEGDLNRVDLVLYQNMPAAEEGKTESLRNFFD